MTDTQVHIPSRPLLSVKEVAVAFDCHHNTVRNLIASGHLDAVRVGRNWRVVRESAVSYLRPWRAA